jgi:hypothetical protein
LPRLSLKALQLNSIELSVIPDNELSDFGCATIATAVDKNSSIHLEVDGKISSEQHTTTLLARAGGIAHAP